MKLELTEGGIEFLLRSMEGGPSPQFCKISIGNGADAGKQAKKLTNPVKDLEIGNMTREGNFVTLYSKMNNSEIAERFRETEMGVYITDPDENSETGVVLFAYGYVPEEEAAVIPAAEDYTFETIQKVMVYVGSTAGVTAILTESQFTVSQEEFDNHAGNKENPHGVTAKQLGIDVENLCKKNVVYTATPNNMVELIKKADAGATIQLSAGTYGRLDLVGENAYPEGLTIVGGAGVKMAGISITSGQAKLTTITSNNPIIKVPDNLTIKDLTLTDSICLRNCAIDGLNILDCHLEKGASIQLSPDALVDKYGKDVPDATGIVYHWPPSKPLIRNIIISGNTIVDAAIKASDKNTSAISVNCVDNAEITNNDVQNAPFNGIHINGQQSYYSTGRIAIISNVIHKSGSRSIRVNALKNAELFVHSNNLKYANQNEDNAEYVKISECENTEYAWSLSGTSGFNKYTDDGGRRNILPGEGITLENCSSIDDTVQALVNEIGDKKQAYSIQPNICAETAYIDEYGDILDSSVMLGDKDGSYCVYEVSAPVGTEVRIETYADSNVCWSVFDRTEDGDGHDKTGYGIFLNPNARDLSKYPIDGICTFDFTFTKETSVLFVSFIKNSLVDFKAYVLHEDDIWTSIAKLEYKVQWGTHSLTSKESALGTGEMYLQYE